MRNLQKIIDRMSLEDKLSEITQLYGNIEKSGEDRELMGIDYGFEIDKHLEENTGSILGVSGASALKAAQKRHLEKSRHKIPLIFMHDIIHGYKTIFPSPLAMSCTWQPELVRKSAEIAAKEAAVSGIHVTFSPMCDLARDARWGRVVETSGEDVYLNALYSRAYVEGYQGDGIASEFKIASCAKHFAAYGMAEGGRDYNTTEVSEYALREHHFPAYKAAIDAGAKMMMTSFNALNGVPASGNKWLFEDVLRKEWGFNGVVISDCTAIIELIQHGYAENEAEAAKKAIDAGVDIEMVSTTYYRNARRLIEEGKLTEEQIDLAVMRVLSLKEELGLFDNPYKDADEELEKKYVLCEEHRSEARRISRESMVLLKNNGVLPLAKNTCNVALIGPLADSGEMLDTWSACGETSDCITLKEALSERLEIKYARGCGITDSDNTEAGEAIELAKSSDIIILALGEEPLMSGESGSKLQIGLPGCQEELAEKIFALGKPVIVILYNGRPLAIPMLDKKADAILEAWFPGTEGNNAVCDILLGDYSPGGRLTMSFPYAVGQCPIYYNRYNTGRPAQDSYNSDRFTSRYMDGQSVPLYPFGYGLTYAEFEYGQKNLSQYNMKMGENIIANCKIRNTGKVTATETVQLYLRDMSGSRVRPIRMLKGFQRLTLKAGEEAEVKFVINEEMLRFNTLENGFSSEYGKFRVYISKDAAAEAFAEFELMAEC
jgi:beta-glucosidase